MAPSNEKLEAALELARSAELVLPLWWTDDASRCACPKGGACTSPGKHPLTRRGKDDASSYEKEVMAWWTRWPKANIGQHTDRIHRFDFDSTEVAEAINEPSLAQFTVVHQTPRPGLHVAFIPPAPMPTQDLYLADGTRLGELRGLDAYVVVPPSTIGERPYLRLSPECVEPMKVDDPLKWLGALLHEYGFELGAGAKKREYTRLVGEIFEGQGRHSALTSLTGRFFIEGLSEEALFGAVDAVNQLQCSPPLSEEELRPIVRHFVQHRKPLASEEEMLSAGTRDRVPAERIKLTFRTARELAGSVPANVPWVAKPWAAAGALTEVDGKVKLSGKTTFLTHLVKCVLDGEPFMGQPTTRTRVAYLTEQGDASFREALKRADLLDRDDLYILSWKDTIGTDWRKVVTDAVEECLRLGVGLLVVDTLPQFAGIAGDGENSSGSALDAMAPLKEATDLHNLAVIASRHERKSGGEVGDSGRGSSAFAGSADIVVSLRRPEGNASPNLRVIHAIGRFDDVPETLVIELTDRGYEARGSEHALGVHRARKAIEDVLPSSEEAAMSMKDLMEATKLGRSALLDALSAMVDDGTVGRVGKGAKGDPHRFWLL